jgi:ribosomal protein L11 methyltransferase
VSGFWQLSFELGARAPDSAEESCFELGATSVTYVDAHDDPVLEPLPGEFRLWPTTRLRALFPGEADADGVAEALTATRGLPPGELRTERLEDRVWEREWLRDFHAMRFGQRLWICPHHEQVTEPGAAVVRMDPGLAFGTGTHPTTALCLEWLDHHIAGGEQLIDFGCGSGVLGMGAVKLGAAAAHCFDIDSQALLATRENAGANGLGSQVRTYEAASELPRGVDVLVANILSGPLCELAPTFGSLVRAGGSIVLAGLLEHQADDVTDAYTPWFDMHAFEVREGWSGLAGKRKSHAQRA